MNYRITTPDKLKELCERNQWFTQATKEQWGRLNYANIYNWPIGAIAAMIWTLTDCTAINKYGQTWCRRDIIAELKGAQKSYKKKKYKNT